MLAKFLSASVRVIVRTIPFDGAILSYNFIPALAGNGHRADLAEAAQPVIVFSMPRQSEDFQRAPQVHIEATLFRLAVQRGRAVNYGIGRMHQAIVLVAAQAKTWLGEIADKDSHFGLQVFVEARELEVQLERTPEAHLRVGKIAGAHQHVQGGAITFQQIGSDVRADVSGRTGQEYRHVAPLVPVFTASPLAGAS